MAIKIDACRAEYSNNSNNNNNSSSNNNNKKNNNNNNINANIIIMVIIIVIIITIVAIIVIIIIVIHNLTQSQSPRGWVDYSTVKQYYIYSKKLVNIIIYMHSCLNSNNNNINHDE